MNMFRAFMELDEAYNDRQTYIDTIKKAGKNYNFNKYSDAQLYRMAQRLQKPQNINKEPQHDLDLDFDYIEPKYCDCGARLTDFDQCPVCDFGEEDLTEFVSASGQQVKLQRSTAPQTTAISPDNTARTTTGKYKVGIVLDKGRLRAMGDDGVHGLAFVAFPNNLRQFEGQHYEVDQLIWNGKNYRVSGKIEEV
jgi:hypothetical protein